jgi:hypothetical protein
LIKPVIKEKGTKAGELDSSIEPQEIIIIAKQEAS